MARDQGLEQIAVALDVSVRSVRRWVTREGCPSERGPAPRRAYLLNLDEVETWRRKRDAEARLKRSSIGPAEPRADDEPAEADELDDGAEADAVPARVQPSGRPARRRRSALRRRLRTHVASANAPEPEPSLAAPVIPADAPAHERVRAAVLAPRTLPTDRQLLGVLELGAALKADLRSVAISRLPTADDMIRLGSNTPAVVAATLTRAQVRALDDKGGLAPQIEERFGPGTFLLTFVGEFGVVLHRDVLVIPDLRREADRVVKELERARAARVAEAEARRLREHEETGQRSFVDYWLAAAIAEATARIDTARNVAGILLGDGVPGRRASGQPLDPALVLRVEALRALADVDLDDVAARVTALLGQLAATHRHGSPRFVASRLEPLLPRPPRNFESWSWVARQEEAERAWARQAWAEQVWAAQV